MDTLKNLLYLIVLIVSLLAASYASKSYLSSSQESIVREFINIPFAMRTSRLLFMNQSVAASQYYQFLAITYNAKLNFPHYHIKEDHEENGHNEHAEECPHCKDGKEHDHPKTEPQDQMIVGHAHGPGGKDILLTRKDVDELIEREKYIKENTSEFIDISYFYDLIDLSNALDANNEYIMLYGKGWILNEEMARKMIEVLKNSFQRTQKWRNMFDAGWIALYNLRDYEEARAYLQIALKQEDAPGYVAGIYTYSFYVDKKYEAAIEQIAYQMSQTKDHGLHTRLEKKLKWYRNLLTLNRAAADDQKKTERDISDLDDLVKEGIIRKIPEDTVGKGFAWDSKNREVFSQNIFDLVK